MIKITSAWVVDSLIIARPGHQVLQGGHNKNGKAQIFVLEPDEVIVFINGANCDYGRSQVTGQVTVITNKRQLGPFGSSGNPNGTHFPNYRHFTETISNVKLTTEQVYNKYLYHIQVLH